MSSTCWKMFFHVYKTTSSWSSKLFGSWWELGGISQNKGHPFCSEAWMRLVDVLPRLLVAQHVQVQTQRESTKGDSTNCFLSPHCYCHYQHHRHGRLRVQLRSHILIYVTQQRLRAWLPALWCSIRTWGAIDDIHTLIEGGLNSGTGLRFMCIRTLACFEKACVSIEADDDCFFSIYLWMSWRQKGKRIDRGSFARAIFSNFTMLLSQF